MYIWQYDVVTEINNDQPMDNAYHQDEIWYDEGQCGSSTLVWVVVSRFLPRGFNPLTFSGWWLHSFKKLLFAVFLERTCFRLAFHPDHANSLPAAGNVLGWRASAVPSILLTRFTLSRTRPLRLRRACVTAKTNECEQPFQSNAN